MMSGIRRWVAGASGLVVAVGCAAAMSGPAKAQQPDRQSAANGRGLEEIVVTARRRAEKLQTVPVAVTVFNGEQLHEKQIQTTEELNKLVPGFNIVEASRNSAANVSLRGLPGVISYFAEVPSARNSTGGAASNTDLVGQTAFFDLENVQVLTGPQGTLFGLNSTGGAVLIEPKRPQNDYEGYLQLTLGSYNWHEIEAAVNVPIVKDKLLVRIAGIRNERDGYTRDLSTGKDLDNEDDWAWRAGLTFRPTDDIENYVLYRGYYQHNNASSNIIQGANCGFTFTKITGVPLTLCNGANYAGLFNPATQIPTFLAGLKAGAFAFAPGLPAVITQQKALGVRTQVGSNSPDGKIINDFWNATDIFRWDIGDNFTFKNILAYTESASIADQDFDGTPFSLIEVHGVVPPPTQTYSEEPQFSGKALNDDLQWQAGAFLSFFHNAGVLYQLNTQTALATGNGVTAGNASGRTQAVYAQGTYDLSGLASVLDGFKFTGGYRYTWDWRSQWSYQRSANGACSQAAASPGNCALAADAHYHSPGYTLSLDYQVTPDAMVYVTSRKAYSSGVFNLSVPPPANVVQPEYVTDVEIGAKTDWDFGGVKARTNVAAFEEWYNNIQRQVAFSYVDATGVTRIASAYQNAATATIQGVEFQGEVVPFAGLTLSGNYQYIYGHYDTYNQIGNNGQLTSLANSPLLELPKNKLSVSVKYDIPVDESWGDIAVLGTYTWQAHEYIAADSDPFAIASGFSRIDARIDWNNVLRRPFDLSFFITNLEDTKYTSGILTLWSSEGFYSKVVGEPRMYGVQLRYRFGPGLDAF